MATTPVISGPLAGHDHVCTCDITCNCETFTAGAENGNHIRDGYILWQVYRQVCGAFVADHVRKQTMILRDTCPRCDRPMPSKTEQCLNCGADMHNDLEKT